MYDAVATQDTVTLVRSAIRGLLRAAPAVLEAAVRAVLGRADDYVAAGKPVCDWDDAAARELLVDELVRDGLAALRVVADAGTADAAVVDAAELLATVVGQDVEEGDDGVFRIARRVARDRVVSTVDPDARHGHKTTARKYDGYKGHVAVDPDSEFVTQTAVTPANVGDADQTQTLLADVAGFAGCAATDTADPADTDTDTGGDAGGPASGEDDGSGPDGGSPCGDADAGNRPRVYGDSAYGSGANLALLDDLDADAMTRTQPAHAPGGRFTKDDFDIDLDADQVTCPGQHTVRLRRRDDGSGWASFGDRCATCPLQAQCTTSPHGRTVQIGPHERLPQAQRARQHDPAWQADYQANRPKVERRLAHLVRRSHGGRKARVRGTQRVDQDWNWNATAHNIARLATLGVRHTAAGWQAATA